MLCMPDLPPQRALKPESPDDKIIWRTALLESSRTRREPVPFPKGTLLRTGFRLNVELFRRFLAKIAHSYAIAKIGFDSVEPFLPNGIMGNDDEEMRHLVGGQSQNDHIMDQFDTYEHQLAIWPIDHDSGQILVVAIRLFASLGMPTYEAIVGRARKEIVF